MMKKLFALLVAGVVASTAFAQEAPDVLVQRVTEEVLEIIRNDREIQNGSTNKVIDLVDKKVLPHFNFQHMTALAMGKEWRKASPQQQQQLTAEEATRLEDLQTAESAHAQASARIDQFKAQIDQTLATLKADEAARLDGCAGEIRLCSKEGAKLMLAKAKAV